MPIKATELKKGVALLWEGQLHMVLETEHVKPGKGPAYVQAKMQNVESGTIKTHRIGSGDRLEDVSITKQKMQYLYDASGYGEGPFVFMEQESFEQIELDKAVLGDQSKWLIENLEVMLESFDGRPLGLEFPAAIELKVTDTAPQPKGATVTNQPKDAVLETGAKVRVPGFIENGQVVRVNPNTGEYLGKA